MTVRVWIEPARLVAGDVAITGADHHYLFRVRRLTVGARVTLFDGAGHQAAAEVVAIDGDSARLRVGSVDAVDVAPACAISIGLALIKGERMEWCIQKLVELGIDRVVPIQTARSVVKLAGARADSRRARWVSIARDAARQCRRATVPDIAPVCSLEDAVADLAAAELRVLLWARESTHTLWSAATAGARASAAVLVGPEGGWTAEEVDLAVAAGFEPAGLGPRVLRAETAAIAAVTALGLAVGDLAGTPSGAGGADAC